MRPFVPALIALLLAGCQPPPIIQDPTVPFAIVKEPLTRVNIVDHSNLSETITSPERLKELAKRNFLDPQPYQKVARVFARNKEGSARSIITSYYDNGQIRQYLECLKSSACLSVIWRGLPSNGTSSSIFLFSLCQISFFVVFFGAINLILFCQ